MWYESGLPFDTTLAENLELLQERVKHNKASAVIIDGQMGEGKTTMACHIADFFNGAYEKVAPKKYIYNPFKAIDLRKQYAMGGEKFIENIQIAIDSQLVTSLYDEGGDFNRRGSLTAFNQQLNRIFETYRAFKFIPIICLPNASVIDRDLYLKGVPRIIIHCENRTDKYGRYRAYSLWRFMYVLQKMTKSPVPQQAYKRTYPNIFGQFLNLPEARQQELHKIGMEGKKQIITNNVLANRGLISIIDLARKANISRPHANRVIRDLGIKAEMEHKKVRYYTADQLQLIKENLKKK